MDAITNIAGFFQFHKKPFRIHDAGTNSLSDLHGRPVVLVNGNDNKWTLLRLKMLRFQFVSNGTYPYVQDRPRPDFRTGESTSISRITVRQRTMLSSVASIVRPQAARPLLLRASARTELKPRVSSSWLRTGLRSCCTLLLQAGKMAISKPS